MDGSAVEKETGGEAAQKGLLGTAEIRILTKYEDMEKVDSTNNFDQIPDKNETDTTDNEEDSNNYLKRDLQKWYESYMREDLYAMEEVRMENLDEVAVEQAIYNLMPSLGVLSTEGYCINCQGFLEGWPEIMQQTQPLDSSFNWSHAKSSLELEASSRIGCRFCTLLMQSIQIGSWSMNIFHKIETRLNELKVPTTIYISIICSLIGDRRQRMLSVHLPGKISFRFEHTGFLWALPVLEAEVPSLPNESDSMDSIHKALSLANNWINECSHSHDFCRARKAYQLPTRLISINDNCIQLVLTSDWTIKPRYATLSHCWGNIEFLKLTRETMKSFLTSIPVEGLSQTFRDAIEITRKLGLRYLWIDSLCIIQNDTQDWEVEAGLMSTVYGGSYINIAAAAAMNGNKGCFQNKLSNFVGKVRAEVKMNECTKFYDFVESDSYELAVPASHLGRRAWALQERLLAPRTIHFSEKEIFWECRMKNACESFPEKLPDVLYKDTYSPRRQSLEANWNQIVHTYTRCSLTYGSDKLVAMSGIAHEIHEENKDQYFAGLWRSRMEVQLCWIADSSIKPRPQTYRAPSWSWASVDIGCDYHDLTGPCDTTLYAHVIDAQVMLSGSDPFGQISAGFIKLSCTTILQGNLHTTMRFSEGDSSYEKNEFTITSSGGQLSRGFYTRLDSMLEPNSIVFVLPIKLVESPEEYCRFTIEGLLIRPTNSSKGEYQRVGYFRLGLQTEGEFTYRDWVEAVQESGLETASSNCAEILSNSQYPDEKYVITII